MEFELNSRFAGMRIISTERSDGPMNFAFDEGRNLTSFLERNKINKSLAFPAQTHGNSVAFCDGPGRVLGVDGLLTREDLVLAVKSADCLPLMIYCPRSKTIGAIHISRHNLILGIINKLVDLLSSHGDDIASCYFFVGPHIRSVSYNLSDQAFAEISKSEFIDFVDEHKKFNLVGAVRFALEQRGALGENIDDCMIDTFRNKRLYSSRSDERNDTQVDVFSTMIFAAK